MGRKYTRAKQVDKFGKVKDFRFLYKEKFITNYGVTSDTGEIYSEVAADWIIINFKRFNQIDPICREKSYYSPDHDGKPKKSKESWEVRIALDMYNLGMIPGVGRILDYQIPLKNKNKDKAGKIDLLAFDEDSRVLRIIELKQPDNEKDTMLRCVLEAYTYLRLVDRVKLIRDFNSAKSLNIPLDTPIIACPLIFRRNSKGEESFQYHEMQEKRPKLKELIELLEVKPMVIEENKAPYIAREL